MDGTRVPVAERLRAFRLGDAGPPRASRARPMDSGRLSGPHPAGRLLEWWSRRRACRRHLNRARSPAASDAGVLELMDAVLRTPQGGAQLPLRTVLRLPDASGSSVMPAAFPSSASASCLGSSRHDGPALFAQGSDAARSGMRRSHCIMDASIITGSGPRRCRGATRALAGRGLRYLRFRRWSGAQPPEAWRWCGAPWVAGVRPHHPARGVRALAREGSASRWTVSGPARPCRGDLSARLQRRAPVVPGEWLGAVVHIHAVGSSIPTPARSIPHGGARPAHRGPPGKRPSTSGRLPIPLAEGAIGEPTFGGAGELLPPGAGRSGPVTSRSSNPPGRRDYLASASCARQADRSGSVVTELVGLGIERARALINRFFTPECFPTAAPAVALVHRSSPGTHPLRSTTARGWRPRSGSPRSW